MTFAKQCLDTRGSAQRTNRNTLVFLAADGGRWDELADATRDYLAWKQVADRHDDLNLTAQQTAQAVQRRDQANDTVRLRILQAYIWALVPEQPDAARPASWSSVKAEGSQDRLADRVTVKMRQNGQLATSYGARNVRMDLDGPLAAVWTDGHVTVGDLWSCYRRYTYLTRLRDRAVLDDALRSTVDDIAWMSEGFALAHGFDAATGRYQGLVTFSPTSNVGVVVDAMLVVRPDVAALQQEAERAAAEAAAGSSSAPNEDESENEGDDSSGGAAGGARSADPPLPRRFYGVVKLNPDRYARDFTRVAQEVLQHLAGIEGNTLEVTLEITSTSGEGFAPDKRRVVSENARNLRFEQSGFETE